LELKHKVIRQLETVTDEIDSELNLNMSIHPYRIFNPTATKAQVKLYADDDDDCFYYYKKCFCTLDGGSSLNLIV